MSFEKSADTLNLSSSSSSKSAWSYSGSAPAYSYGGNIYNSSSYLANPSRSVLKTLFLTSSYKKRRSLFYKFSLKNKPMILVY